MSLSARATGRDAQFLLSTSRVIVDRDFGHYVLAVYIEYVCCPVVCVLLSHPYATNAVINAAAMGLMAKLRNRLQASHQCRIGESIL